MNETAMYWDNDQKAYTLTPEESAPAERYAEVARGDDGFIAETWRTAPDGLAVRIMFSEEHYQDAAYQETTRKNMERRNQCTLVCLRRIKLPAALYDETLSALSEQ